LKREFTTVCFARLGPKTNLEELEKIRIYFPSEEVKLKFLSMLEIDIGRKMALRATANQS
jgi:hypothetical protein